VAPARRSAAFGNPSAAPEPRTRWARPRSRNCRPVQLRAFCPL